jgi:hypothetical protein
MFPAEAVTVSGETRSFADRHFCPTCGSPVFARWDDEVSVNLGSLDEPSRFRPTYELWTIRREDWLPEFSGMRHYRGNRENAGREEPQIP